MLDTPLDTDVPALLLRLDRNPFHHGSLGAVRSLGRAGVEVHAFVESPRGPLARSRYLHGRHVLVPPPDAERALLRAAERIGRPAVLLPMDDAGAIVAARLAERLRGRFLLPAQPCPGAVERAADKAELAGLCGRLGIPHPPTALPGSAAEARSAARELGLPVIAKWSRPWLLPPGGEGLRSTTVLGDETQAGRLYERGAREAGPGNRLLLQRLLPGGRRSDWFFHGCFAEQGRLLLGGTGVKELSWPVGAGLTALGRWLPNAEVADAARRLASHLGYAGVLDLDFRRDAATGAYHLLDVNPRPGAQFRLFTDRAGLDVVRALHLDLTGRPVPAPAPQPGRVFLAENYGLASGLVSALTGRGGPGRLGRRVETAWFATDDPAPFWAMAHGWGLGRITQRARRNASQAAKGREALQAAQRDKAEKERTRCMTW
ncbi:carboxylate--amine ligase [Streptomyces sp. 6N223]|uniref:carboxylate--amine ligase n=1 Tax=Streptomyces sp. 6N223 TaxID=3457412 RepID=UPI003FD6157E